MASNSYETGRLNLPFAGIDLVEVAPDYDHSGSTTTLAAQVLMNLIGRVMHARGT